MQPPTTHALLLATALLHATTTAQQITPHTRTITFTLPTATTNKTALCLITAGPALPVTAVAFSPNGKSIATAAHREVLIWDLTTAKLTKRIGCAAQIFALTFTKDGKRIAVAEGTPRQAGALRITETETGQNHTALTSPKDALYCLAISPDGKLIAAGAADSNTYIWSTEENKLLTTAAEHTDRVLAAAFSPDNKFLATASADRTVRIRQTADWKTVLKIDLAEPVCGIAFNTDGQLIAIAVAGSKDRSINIRRRDNGHPVRTIETGAASPQDIIWTPNTNRLMVPCDDGKLRAYDANNGHLLFTAGNHNGPIISLAITPDTTLLATGSTDGTAKLWRANDGHLLATLIQLAPQTDQWLLVTTAGYIACSNPTALTWKTTNLTTPPNQLHSRFQNTELIQQALAGKTVPPPAID